METSYGHRGKQTSKQTNKQTGKSTEPYVLVVSGSTRTYPEKHMKIDPVVSEIQPRTNKQTNKQTNRQTDKPTETYIDRAAVYKNAVSSDPTDPKFYLRSYYFY